MRHPFKLNRRRRRLLALIVAIGTVGYLLPERGVIPVRNATTASWNPESFWYFPWGESGVHKGIDIFADAGTPVLAATTGLVTFSGSNRLGGNVILVLGPKWRLHYYAHLQRQDVKALRLVRRGQVIGYVGSSGNAKDTPPHLHYVIRTPFPVPWEFRDGYQGWKRMFFFDPVSRFKAWGVVPPGD